jgi:hypothetical protein
VGERYWIWWGRGRALLDLEGSWESTTGFGVVVGERGRGSALLDLETPARSVAVVRKRYRMWRGRGRALLDLEGSRVWDRVT